MSKPEHIINAEKECGIPYDDWSKVEQAHHWYGEIEQRGIEDRAVDGLFEAIGEHLNDAEVPSSIRDEVFSLINEDYTVRRN